MKKFFLMISTLYASCLVAGNKHQSDLERLSVIATSRLKLGEFSRAAKLIEAGATPDCKQTARSIAIFEASNNETIFGYFLRCLKEHRTFLTGLPNKVEKAFIYECDSEDVFFAAKKVEQAERGLFSFHSAYVFSVDATNRFESDPKARARCQELNDFLVSAYKSSEGRDAIKSAGALWFYFTRDQEEEAILARIKARRSYRPHAYHCDWDWDIGCDSRIIDES